MNKLNETTRLKARLYAALLRKPKEQITDSEQNLISALETDCDIEGLLESDRLRLIEHALGQKD